MKRSLFHYDLPRIDAEFRGDDEDVFFEHGRFWKRARIVQTQTGSAIGK